jgi:hypothetical protein
MKFVEKSGYADPEAAARKLVEIANLVEAMQDDRIFIQLPTAVLYELSAEIQQGLPSCSPELIRNLRVPGLSNRICVMVIALGRQARPMTSTLQFAWVPFGALAKTNILCQTRAPAAGREGVLRWPVSEFSLWRMRPSSG